MWRESNQDGRTESSLVCLIGVGTERGMHKVRTVRRREATGRVDLMFLYSVSARPWDGPKEVRDVRIVLPDVSSPAAVAEAEAIGKGRRLKISKADIMKHGLTEGCLGCRCQRAQGHSEGCRTRLEAEFAKSEDGRARLTKAYLRSSPRDEGRGTCCRCGGTSSSSRATETRWGPGRADGCPRSVEKTPCRRCWS